MKLHRLLVLTVLSGLFVAPAVSADNPSANSPNGTVAKADGKMISVVDVATGKVLIRIAGDANVTALVFSPDGKMLVSATADNFVRYFDGATGKEILRIKAPEGLKSLAVSADGRTLVASDKDKVLRKWALATGKEVE